MTLDKGQLDIGGVHVEFAKPVEETLSRPPLVMVHGGCDGSWVWHNHLDYFAIKGWSCYALSWFNHPGSVKLPENEFLNRSIADVQKEIGLVVHHLGRTPILIGHSMGGMACQKYAEKNEVEGLVLITPVVPAEVGERIIGLPANMDEPWGPPSLEVARTLFFPGSPEEDVQRYHSQLVSESPRAVLEATRWTIHVDKKCISSPILVISAELDTLTPPDLVRKLADFYGADYFYTRGKGHNLLLDPRWIETATRIEGWLARNM